MSHPGRSTFDPFNRYAANGVRLMQGDRASYPLDYVIGENEDRAPDRTCLCDRWLNQDVAVRQTTVVSVWLRDPEPDVSTVTLEVKDLLRLTDVPVV